MSPTAENDAPDYRCVMCGERATHFTSLAGQAQTFYCADHAPTAEKDAPYR